MANYRFTAKSANAKTGPIPVTTTSADTCPDACPLKRAGCYADGGPLRILWDRLAAGGLSLAELCEAIHGLPDGQLWRHNQAGDLPGAGDKINARELAAIVRANSGRRGFTYTHKPPAAAGNAKAIAAANAAGFTVNLSANNPAHADTLAALDIGPVVTVLPADTAGRTAKTPAGRTIAVCPAVYSNKVSCATCGLCQRQNRRVIVGFPAHGSAKRKADNIARG